MKKLLSTLLVIFSLSVGCAHLTFSSIFFANASDSKHEMQNSKGHDMSDMLCGAQEESHECCYSPFSDSTTFLNIQNNENDDNENSDFGIDYIALLNKDFLDKLVNRLNSPPGLTLKDQFFSRDETYSSLVGVIKNNA